MDCLTVCHLKYDAVRSGRRITPILNPQKRVRVPHDSNGVMMHALQSQSQTSSCTIFETWTFVRNKHTTNMPNTSKYQTLSLNIVHVVCHAACWQGSPKNFQGFLPKQFSSRSCDYLTHFRVIPPPGRMVWSHVITELCFWMTEIHFLPLLSALTMRGNQPNKEIPDI